MKTFRKNIPVLDRDFDRDDSYLSELRSHTYTTKPTNPYHTSAFDWLW